MLVVVADGLGRLESGAAEKLTAPFGWCRSLCADRDAVGPRRQGRRIGVRHRRCGAAMARSGVLRYSWERGRSDADHGAPPLAVTATGGGTRAADTAAFDVVAADVVAADVAATGISAEPLDDLTLVVRAQEGDTRSFAALVRRHQRPLFRLAVRLLGNRSDAEDALQEAFVAAWRRLGGFRGQAAFSSWMYRIVTNRCLTLLRTRRPVIPLDELGDQPTPAGSSPEHAAETRDRADALNRALQALPLEQRACWILRELHGLSYEDIAAIVEASPDAVRGRLHRARRTLVEVMAPWR